MGIVSSSVERKSPARAALIYRSSTLEHTLKQREVSSSRCAVQRPYPVCSRHIQARVFPGTPLLLQGEPCTESALSKSAQNPQDCPGR
jgi:hypothetical protein